MSRKVDENWDISFVIGEYLTLLGYGQMVDVVARSRH